MSQLGRDVLYRYERSFPGHQVPEISKFVRRTLEKYVAAGLFNPYFCHLSSVTAYRQLESVSSMSGRTRPENSPDEDLVR